MKFPKKIKVKKIDEKQLDKMWSEIVKLKAGMKCEKCGKTLYLNSHHIFSRSNRSVRWDLSNGICLCSGHHTLCNDSAHKAPADFIEWLKEYRGSEWYDEIRLKAHSVYDKNYEATLEELTSLLQDLQ